MARRRGDSDLTRVRRDCPSHWHRVTVATAATPCRGVRAVAGAGEVPLAQPSRLGRRAEQAAGDLPNITRAGGREQNNVNAVEGQYHLASLFSIAKVTFYAPSQNPSVLVYTCRLERAD